MKDVLEIIQQRKSVRQYLDKHIPDEDLKKILEAGRLAPSWMNVQSWDFILVKSQEMKNMLCNLSLGQAHVKNADALIVCVADLHAWEHAGITNIKNPALNPALQGSDGIKIRTLEQVIFPVSYMMLEAEALGISSCIIGAFGSEITGVLEENQKEAKEALGLKDWHIISTIITLGYEANPQSTTNKVRKDFNEVVSLEHLGNIFQ
ncbi:nitroreductase family protein [bacterium]|nr:nitroreductase family protein [bacterium]